MLTRPTATHTMGANDQIDPPRAASREFERFLSGVTAHRPGPISLKDWRDLAEAWLIARALESCQGNRSAAARELGIGRRTLYAKIERLGLATPQEFA